MKYKIHIICLLAAMVSSCATNTAKFAETPAIDKNKSEIVIFRKDKFAGGGSCQLVTIDGKEIGVLQSGGFIKVLVDPGDHNIILKKKAPTRATLTTTGGKTYYLEYLTASGGIFPIPIGPVVTIVSTLQFKVDLVSKDYAMTYLPDLKDSLPSHGCFSPE
jgi:hypothetical protein